MVLEHMKFGEAEIRGGPKQKGAVSQAAEGSHVTDHLLEINNCVLGLLGQSKVVQEGHCELHPLTILREDLCHDTDKCPHHHPVPEGEWGGAVGRISQCEVVPVHSHG